MKGKQHMVLLGAILVSALGLFSCTNDDTGVDFDWDSVESSSYERPTVDSVSRTLGLSTWVIGSDTDAFSQALSSRLTNVTASYDSVLTDVIILQGSQIPSLTKETYKGIAHHYSHYGVIVVTNPTPNQWKKFSVGLTYGMLELCDSLDYSQEAGEFYDRFIGGQVSEDFDYDDYFPYTHMVRDDEGDAADTPMYDAVAFGYYDSYYVGENDFSTFTVDTESSDADEVLLTESSQMPQANAYDCGMLAENLIGWITDTYYSDGDTKGVVRDRTADKRHQALDGTSLYSETIRACRANLNDERNLDGQVDVGEMKIRMNTYSTANQFDSMTSDSVSKSVNYYCIQISGKMNNGRLFSSGRVGSRGYGSWEYDKSKGITVTYEKGGKTDNDTKNGYYGAWLESLYVSVELIPSDGKNNKDNVTIYHCQPSTQNGSESKSTGETISFGYDLRNCLSPLSMPKLFNFSSSWSYQTQRGYSAIKTVKNSSDRKVEWSFVGKDVPPGSGSDHQVPSDVQKSDFELSSSVIFRVENPATTYKIRVKVTPTYSSLYLLYKNFPLSPNHHIKRKVSTPNIFDFRGVPPAQYPQKCLMQLIKVGDEDTADLHRQVMDYIGNDKILKEAWKPNFVVYDASRSSTAQAEAELMKFTKEFTSHATSGFLREHPGEYVFAVRRFYDTDYPVRKKVVVKGDSDGSSGNAGK